ncbi:MAG TPA: hypothetical protein VFD84_14450 [Candidatus Binatia bacterium]|jgi:hypothetical protein|nr:hypothetical protein [Candidatus Binatia bacterium]
MAERFGRHLVRVRFQERGWNGHQDVWSYSRAVEAVERTARSLHG